MDRNICQLNKFIIFIFLTNLYGKLSYADMGKSSSPQNHFGIVGQSQFITRNNTRITAQKGGLAILPCVVKINSPATVSWIRRKDFQLLTVGLSTHSSDKRFIVEHTRHMGHWSLRIKSVREEDRGLYECQLSIYPTQSIFIELKIVEAVAEISGSPDLHIDESSTLRLECKLRRATEDPAFIFWYHGNKMVNYDSQGGFSVSSTISSSQNKYDFGNSLTKSSLTSSVRNSTANMSLNFFENNDSSKVHTTVISQQQQSSYLLQFSMSILSIKEVHFHHAGNYTCAPSNARPASITVHVLRGERPAAMQHSNRSIVENENTNNNSVALYGISVLNSGTSLKIFNSIFLSITILLIHFVRLSHLYFAIDRQVRKRIKYPRSCIKNNINNVK